MLKRTVLGGMLVLDYLLLLPHSTLSFKHSIVATEGKKSRVSVYIDSSYTRG